MLEMTKKALANQGYQMARLLDFSAVWLSNVVTFNSKIEMGRLMGLLARGLETVLWRTEQLGAPALACYDASFESALSAAAQLTGDEAILGFLHQRVRFLWQEISAFKSQVCDISDEPSWHALDMVSRILEGVVSGGTHHRLHTQGATSFSSMSEAHMTCRFAHEGFGALFAAEGVPYSGREPLPARCSTPLREDCVKPGKESYFLHSTDEEMVKNDEALNRFIHFVLMEIEFCAMEVCGRSLSEHRHMPLAYKIDFSRQIWDEGRHAMALWRLLRSRGAELGDHPFMGFVWKNYNQAQNIEECLAIQNVIMEGNGFEDSVGFIQLLKNAGQSEVARVWEFVTADEAGHVQIGNKWLLHVLDQSPTRYKQVVETCVERLRTTIPLQGVTFCPASRRLCGFPEPFIHDKMVELAIAEA